MKHIALALITVLAGCATEKVYHTQTATGPTGTGLAVLVSRSARIEDRQLIWSCVYQTPEGQLTVEQREECYHTH